VRYARDHDDELAAHLMDLLAQLDQWRTLAGQRPIADVLWMIYDTTGYLAFCAGLDDGEQRVANLTRLHERARQFGAFQRQGLRRFIQFLRSLQDDEQDLRQPSVASEADDVVRVMSIHASKGLEFPVVIVPDLGKKHNLQDTAGPILFDRDAGLGLLCADETRRIRYPSMASVLVGEQIRRQTLAEELRVLYVAMTRAREHLILVGTCAPKMPEKWAQRWTGHRGPLPADEVLRGGCALDWLGPVAAATAHMVSEPIEVRTHGDEEMRALESPALHRPKRSERQQRLARLEPQATTPPPNADAERIRRRLTDAYPHRTFTRLAASQTVGSLTKSGRSTFAGEHASREPIVRFGQELPAPRCVLESLSASPMEVGAVTHLVLQHLDFARPCTRDDVKQQIAQMVARRHVAPGEADVVDVDAIVWFAATDLGKLLHFKSAELMRELPVFFPMQVEPSQDPLDRVMVRGRLDVIVPTDEGLLLVDYKTDRVTAQTIDARAEFYRSQVSSYARAVEGITGARVKAGHLVFLAAREIRSA
jgi:ATP-dependent helicase/nuclease subunit A